ncbi:MAG: helix-hairpin-helix domain-containing protein [Lewinellaceae bacterium]|nr:helix-hairpin-helix domain-containing protein [Lewinellaceae bacterium]
MKWIDWLHFTRAERTGMIVLSGVCLTAALLPLLLPYLPTKDSRDQQKLNDAMALYQVPAKTVASKTTLFYFNPNTATKEELLQLGLSEKAIGTLLRYRAKGGTFRRPEDLEKMYSLSKEEAKRLMPWVRFREQTASKPAEPAAQKALFSFDPNTATEEELLRLGIPTKTVGNMLRYREKAGQFRQASDLEKIYGMPETCFKALLPYINIAPLKQTNNTARNFASGPEKYAPKILRVDINQADATAWEQLPGIGTGRAKQIIRFRERLGGFNNPIQVGETWGLPDSVFQKILPWLDPSPLIKKIDLNSISREDLVTHPYFSFKQADLIIAYRDQHGPFHALEDLSNIPPLRDPVWIQKIKPYILLP